MCELGRKFTIVNSLMPCLLQKNRHCQLGEYKLELKGPVGQLIIICVMFASQLNFGFLFGLKPIESPMGGCENCIFVPDASLKISFLYMDFDYFVLFGENWVMAK